MTPQQLLDQPPQHVTRNVAFLWGMLYSHVPEMVRGPSTPCEWFDPAAFGFRASGVTARVYKLHRFNRRHVWHIASVHVRELPVMLTRNAGREGDDFADRYVFDLFLYGELLELLGRKPSDRRHGSKTRLGWQDSTAWPRDYIPGDRPAESFACRSLFDSEQDWAEW